MGLPEPKPKCRQGFISSTGCLGKNVPPGLCQFPRGSLLPGSWLLLCSQGQSHDVSLTILPYLHRLLTLVSTSPSIFKDSYNNIGPTLTIYNNVYTSSSLTLITCANSLFHENSCIHKFWELGGAYLGGHHSVYYTNRTQIH
jgi:hypothetical protein